MNSRHTPALTCPLCQQGLQRVRRSFNDRLLSLFVPTQRYRCASVACGWEGLFRRRSSGHMTRTYQGGKLLEPSRPGCDDAERLSLK